PSLAPAPPPRRTDPLHDALPICLRAREAERLPRRRLGRAVVDEVQRHDSGPAELAAQLREEAGLVRRELGLGRLRAARELLEQLDRKSTRLNSSHVKISYAVFRL